MDDGFKRVAEVVEKRLRDVGLQFSHVDIDWAATEHRLVCSAVLSEDLRKIEYVQIKLDLVQLHTMKTTIEDAVFVELRRALEEGLADG